MASDEQTRRIRGRWLGLVDRPAEEMAVFIDALSEALERPFFPASWQVESQDIIKLDTNRLVRVGDQTRTIFDAKLNGYPVIISHRHPPKPPIIQKFLLFADVDLAEHLELRQGKSISLVLYRKDIGRATLMDWGKSLSRILNSGIDR